MPDKTQQVILKLKDVQKTFRKTLGATYPKEEVDNFFFMLADSFYNVSRLQLALKPDLWIENQEQILDALEALKQERPIQYILGKTEFCGMPFKVNAHVLIPRPETEGLVDWVVSEYKAQNSELQILDIGTGSGCIAVALAKNLPKAKVYALDVSKKALKVAKQNTKLNKVNVEFIEADILKPEVSRDLKFENLKFDIIVSNPPYVREKEKPQMKNNVLNNEPHLALFVKDENPLLFYDAISNFATHKLNANGMLFFEINEYLGRDMIRLLHEKQYKNIELKQDIFKKDRMIKGCLN